MAKPVSLKEVAETLDALMDEMSLYIHQETGELYWISEDDVSLVENEEEQEDLPDWQVEMIPKIKEILDGNHWIALPDKSDIHEWEIMREFVDSVDEEDIRQDLARAIHGSGAFRYFKDTIHRYGIQNQWYEFKRQAIELIVREALEEANIPYE